MASFAGPRSLRQLLDAVQTVASDLDLPAILRRITAAAVELVDARYGALGVLDAEGRRLAEFITVGVDDERRRAIGHPPEGHGILGLLIVDARPLRLADLSQHSDSFGFPPGHPPMRSFLGVPIRVRGEVFGNLYLTDKHSAEVFTDVDEELVVSLAGAAGVAIENARLSERVRRLALVEDRERIARDLHDTVIQRLFATGISLQATTRLVDTEPLAAVVRIEQAVDDLDETIRELRTAIFGLEHPAAGRAGGLRAAAADAVADATAALGFEPRLVLEGPLDSAVPDATAHAAVAAVREALSNVARHAAAAKAEVRVVVDADLLVEVTDDGTGLRRGRPTTGHGLRNLAARATQLGGTFETRAGPGTGTVASWRVPLPDRPPSSDV